MGVRMNLQSLGEVTIKVTPEILTQQADEVTRRVNSLSHHFSELENLVQRTEYYWLGEGGEYHRRLYESRKEEIRDMLRRLSEHPIDLLKISGNYTAAEKENTERANLLMDDAIS